MSFLLSISASENATFDDDDSNNVICLPFGEVTLDGAGIRICPGDDEPQKKWIVYGWQSLLAIISACMIVAVLLSLCILCLLYPLSPGRKNKVDVEQTCTSNTDNDDVTKVERELPETIDTAVSMSEQVTTPDIRII